MKIHHPMRVVTLAACCLCLSHAGAQQPTGVWAWGYNGEGQLGDGTGTNRYTPVPVSRLTNVIAVSAGGTHTLTLMADGTVWAMGRNEFGEVGDGTTANRSIPVLVSRLTNVASVSAGYIHSLAVLKSGSAWAWGGNDYGQLGDGTAVHYRTSPVPVVTVANVGALSAGWFHSISLQTGGAVAAWGLDDHGQLGTGSFADASAVTAGKYHNLALKSDGSVWAWGYNAYGQLGDGTTIDRTIPVQVMGLTDVVSVSAGQAHSLAVKKDGTVWAWGWNTYGQLGDGTTADRHVPVQVICLSNVVSVSAGQAHSLATTRSGTVAAWGGNYWGAIGDGTTVDRHTPQFVQGLTNVLAVSAGGGHSVALAGPHLRFRTEPQLNVAGVTFFNQPIVEARYPDESVAPAFADPIAISIKPGTGWPGAVVSGTTTVSPINGVATFTDLSVDKAGTGYVLLATSGTLQPVESQPFTVYPLPAHLVFAPEPGGAEAGKRFGQQPILLARDAGNLLMTGYNGPVTLGIKPGTGAAGAVLGGTTTVVAVNGVATFTNLSIDRKGAGYMLEALVGTAKLGESAAFNVAPMAEKLAFTVQPGGATDDFPFTAQPIVTVQDAGGETATLYNGPVILAIMPGTGAAGATLTGVSTVNALHGIAGFAGLGIPKIGTGYVLTASAPGLAAGDSATFDVVEAPKLLLRQSSPDEIEVSLKPAGLTITGATIVLSWNAADLKAVGASDVTLAPDWSEDWRDNTGGLTLTLSNADGTGANGPLATIRLTAQPGLSGRSAPVTLTGDSNVQDASYDTVSVSPRTVAFIPGAHLAFTKQPVLTTAGEAIAGQPTVTMMDGTSAIVTDFADAVTMSIAPGTGAPGAVLGGTTAVNAAAGVAAFTNLTIDRKGTGYVLVAASGVSTVESLAFDIAPKALKLAFTTQPGGARAGLPLTPQPVVTVQDNEGATAVAFSGSVTLGIKPGMGFPGATLDGAKTLNAIAGVATYTDVRINTAAPGYVLTASGQSLTGAESAAFDILPFTFTTADLVNSLRWSSGIATLPAGFLPRFDVVANGKVDIADAVRIARKAVGLEANP